MDGSKGIGMTPAQLQAIRTKADLSLSQMAEYLCVSERTLRRYEDGTRNPGAPVVKLYGLLDATITADS